LTMTAIRRSINAVACSGSAWLARAIFAGSPDFRVAGQDVGVGERVSVAFAEGAAGGGGEYRGRAELIHIATERVFEHV
jgi:hypothetical protein